MQLDWEAPLLFGLESKLSECLEKGLSVELATGLGEALQRNRLLSLLFKKTVH